MTVLFLLQNISSRNSLSFRNPLYWFSSTWNLWETATWLSNCSTCLIRDGFYDDLSGVSNLCQGRLILGVDIWSTESVSYQVKPCWTCNTSQFPREGTSIMSCSWLLPWGKPNWYYATGWNGWIINESQGFAHDIVQKLDTEPRFCSGDRWKSSLRIRNEDSLSEWMSPSFLATTKYITALNQDQLRWQRQS